ASSTFVTVNEEERSAKRGDELVRFAPRRWRSRLTDARAGKCLVSLAPGEDTGSRRQVKKDALCGIEHAVSNHSWAQTLAPQSKEPEHQPKDKDQRHAPHPLVAMPGAEDESRSDKPGVDVPAKNRELLLQVSAEDNFFHEAGNSAQQNEEQKSVQGMRGQQA